MSGELERAIRELEHAARELRDPEVTTDRAAELVDRCAEIANLVGAELARAGQQAERGEPGSGQESLL